MAEKCVMEYEFTYKNGNKETIKQTITEDDLTGMQEVNQTIKESFASDSGGYISIGDEAEGRHVIRLSQVMKVKVKVKEA